MTLIDSTTGTEVRRKPSPRPRRPEAGAATAGDAPASTLQPASDSRVGQEATAIDHNPGGEGSSPQPTLHPPPVTLRDRLPELWPRIRDYWVPPALLTEPPPTVAELVGYARHGRWTVSTGKLRRLGVWWHWLVGLPVTVVCRYTEWIFQRPGRTVPVFLVWKLFILTGAGPWLAHNIIRPALAIGAWVWL